MIEAACVLGPGVAHFKASSRRQS